MSIFISKQYNSVPRLQTNKFIKDDKLVVEIALPGANKNDINAIKTDDGVLVTYDYDKQEGDGLKYIHEGIDRGSFSKTFNFSGFVFDRIVYYNGIISLIFCEKNAFSHTEKVEIE